MSSFPSAEQYEIILLVAECVIVILVLYGLRKRQRGGRPEPLDFVMPSTQHFIAFFTVILAIATIFLWLATRDLVEDARKTSERQLRPYLHILPGGIETKIFSDGSIEVTMKPLVKVFGQTPAGGVNPMWDLKVAAFPFNRETFTFVYPVSSTSNAIVAPGEPIRISPKTTTMTEEDARQISLGLKRIYAYGTVAYYDAFGKGRWTNFCFSNDLKDLRASERCPIHNSADWNVVTKSRPTLAIVPME